MKEWPSAFPKGAQGCVLGPEVPGRDGGAAAAGRLCGHHRLSGAQPRGDQVHRCQGDALPADEQVLPKQFWTDLPSGTSNGPAIQERWTRGCCRSRADGFGDAGSIEGDLRLAGIVKRFGAVVALAGVDLERPQRGAADDPRSERLGQDHAAQGRRGLRDARRGRGAPGRRPQSPRAARRSATSAWCSRTTPCSRI